MRAAGGSAWSTLGLQARPAPPPPAPCCHSPTYLLLLRQRLHILLHAPQQDGPQLLLHGRAGRGQGAGTALVGDVGMRAAGLTAALYQAQRYEKSPRPALPRPGPHLQRLDLRGRHASAVVAKLFQKALLVCREANTAAQHGGRARLRSRASQLAAREACMPRCLRLPVLCTPCRAHHQSAAGRAG